MTQNPSLLEALARERVGELRRTAGEERFSRSESRRSRGIKAVRQGTGWLLVDMGLRLAVTRSAINHPVSRG